MRFSKAKMIDHITQKMICVEREFGLDPNNGTSQLKNADKDTVIAYGKYEALEELFNDLEWNFEVDYV